MNTPWPIRSLAECGQLLSGGTPSKSNPDYWGGDIPWFSSKEIKTFELSDAELHVTRAGAEHGTNLIPRGTVLFVVRGMSLANEFRVGVTTVDATFNQDVKALVPKAEVDSRYLTRCLRWLEPQVLALTEESSHGTKRLPGHVFEQLPIPLPPLSEQRCIADILDRADAVRRKRTEAVVVTEELLRSVFLEMFGDPVTNPKGWDTVTIGELTERGASLVDGPFGSNLKPEHYVAEGVRVIRNYNINDDRFDPSQFKYVTAEKFEEIRRSEVRPGDVLITTKGTVGDVCLMPDLGGPAVLSATGTVRLRLPAAYPILGNFVVSQMTQPTYKRYIHSFEAGSAQQYLNLSGIRKMALLVPPQDRQLAFCRAKLEARRLRGRMLEAAAEADGLFCSLVDRAFRGELSRRAGAGKKQLEMFSEPGADQ